MTPETRRHDSLSHDAGADLPADLYDLYAQFGIAAETAQVLEVEAGNLALAYLAIFVKPGEVSAQETEVFRAVIDDLNRKTLGAMFRHIRKIAQIDPALLAIMDKALERRNYLIHHFFRTHNFAIQSSSGRATMLRELNQISADLRHGLQILGAMTGTLNQLVGQGKDLNTIVEKLVERGKSIDI